MTVIMDPLSTLASIIAIIGFTKEITKYASGVRGATTDRKEFYDELLGFAAVLDNIRRRYEALPANDPLRLAISLDSDRGPLIQVRTSLEQLVAKLATGVGHKRQICGALRWPFEKADVEKLMSRIERAKATLTFALGSATLEGVGHIIASLDDVAATLSHQDHREWSREVDQMAGWLSPLNDREAQNLIFGQRAKGTGEWLLDTPEFQGWRTGSQHHSRLLWLRGPRKSGQGNLCRPCEAVAASDWLE
jgi:hypothetical protein